MGYKEAQRAENMVKYKDEIMSRPKPEWHVNYKENKDLQKASKKDLKEIGTKFEDSLFQLSKEQKSRDKKAQRKEEERLEKVAAKSVFGQDKEGRKPGKEGS